MDTTQERLEGISLIGEMMDGFAERTGLAEGFGSPKRYLWTDAFAVCNYLELFRESGDDRFLRDAVKLVDQVHYVLGRHRRDDPREGWISGLSEDEGVLHPTWGGLRIGKEMNERLPGQQFDEGEEWSRDGQYFHYLTKWMHALDQMARVTGESRYHRWAVELAQAAHDGFAYESPSDGTKRLYWKMSIDLTRPLTPSSGQHDPLDALITYKQLQAGIERFGSGGAKRDLAVEITEMAATCEGASWRTSDPLGIGGLLTDACRLAQLVARYELPESERLDVLLHDAVASLGNWVRSDPLSEPLPHRLAFRELGLAIGLYSIRKTRELIASHPEKFLNRRVLEVKLADLEHCLPWREEIEEFWLRAASQASVGWLAHREINTVMLATTLGPDGFVMLEGGMRASAESE